MEQQNNNAKHSRKLIIRYSRYNELQAVIQNSLESMRTSGEPHCMALTGRTGVGKTTLIQDYIQNYTQTETNGGTRKPFLYVNLLSPVTAKWLAMQMLDQLGDPAAYKGSLASRNTRLQSFLEQARTELIILDDFQHIIDSDTRRIQMKVLDWITYLIDVQKISVLLVCPAHAVEAILQSNPRLSRLTGIRETLEEFSWDTANRQVAGEFSKFVQAAEKSIEMKLPWQSEHGRELLFRLYYATDGVVSNIMALLRISALRAEKQNLDSLTMDILADSFDRHLAKYLQRPNPFRLSLDEQFRPENHQTKPPSNRETNDDD